MALDFKSFEFETKEVDTDEGTFVGYGSIFGNKDQGGDVVITGAFTKSLQRRPVSKVAMLWQHDPSQPIGIWQSIEEDDRGLKMSGQLLLDIPQAKIVHTLLKAGGLGGLSMGYKTIDYEITGKGTERQRELKEVELWEASHVTFPMNEEAEVTDVKNLQYPHDVERILRKGGVPGEVAKLVARYGYDEAMNRLNDGHRQGDGSYKALKQSIQELKESINAQG